ncbi:putative permease [Tahibacter aquaticus]|uniref:Putative permease n=1 Tax=Tahibacter aquaticus TaxID=520092 RepID=A0A4R6Z0M8_9GAMM|nr:ABC transporter permease [Tahibacter aquaticus]TDR45087.1 putative permease [Tahibacter aquaticus]
MLHISDFKYALRLLKKTPGFTALTILVLAGGLAISLYTFGLLNTLLYKDLPIADGGSVVRVVGERKGRISTVNAYLLSEIRAGGIRSLSELGAYSATTLALGDKDSVRNLSATLAEWNVFEFSRTKPLMGRGFVREDSTDGAEAVVVLGYKVWQSAFAGDPNIIDRSILLNRKPTRVVGVMPKDYAFPGSASLWLPISSKDLQPTGYTANAYSVYARLAPGASHSQVRTELQGLMKRVQQQDGRADSQEEDLDGLFPLTFQSVQTYPEGPFVFAILNAVSLFILLLACVNVGNMLLARTNERMREIAVRVALGAPRLRLLLQMTLESMIICVSGGIIAVLLAGWALKSTNGFIATVFEGNLPYWWNWGLDGATVTAAAVFIPLMILLVSVMPVYGATRINASALLRDGTRGSQGRTSGRISRILVTIQIALISVVLLVGTAMGIIAYRAGHIDFGIDPTNLLTMQVDLRDSSQDTPEKQLLFYQRLLGELRGSSDIDAALLTGNLGASRFAVDDMEYSRIGDYPEATLLVTSESPGQIGTRLLEGRNFDSRDSETGLKTAVISQSLARAYWGGESALGKRIRLLDEQGKTTEQRIVIGVVSDVRRGENLLVTDKNTFAAIYQPLPQAIEPVLGVLVRHRGSAAAARTAMYRAVSNVDAYVVPGPIANYDDSQKKLTLVATTMTDLFVRCGIFAILLAMTGIYGLSSNTVVQRTHEIGLRRAVGATDRSIIWLFLRQGGRQVTAGLLISALISIGILYLLSRFAGLGTLTLVVVGVFFAALVTGLVMSAIYIATRRVVKNEPSVALRYE